MLLLLAAPPPTAGALASVRTFSPLAAVTNSPIIVTVTLTNTTTNSLRGFFDTEEVPSGLAVNPIAVSIGGRSLSNVIVEAGQDGDVYPGYTPWRWVLETPTNFVEGNPLPPGARLQFSYALGSSASGQFVLQDFGWFAAAPNSTNAAYGFNAATDRRTVKYVTATGLPLVLATPATNNYALQVDGVPGVIYVLFASSNLVQWTPLATNVSPFTMVETNWRAFPKRFYHASPYNVPGASLFVQSWSPANCVVRISGVPGAAYQLEKSLDLTNWAPMAADFAPFNFADTNIVGHPRGFYRGRLIPP